MPENFVQPGQFTRAWKRFGEDIAPSRSGIRSAVSADLSHPARDLRSNPRGREIAGLLAEFGRDLVLDHPGTSAVALSLRVAEAGFVSDQPCVTFFVANAEAARRMPSTVFGVPADTVIAGTPHEQAAHTPGQTFSPLQPGCSVAHGSTSSGTFGCLVEDGNGTRYILSCSHVLANGYPGTVGDPILHPGPRYGGSLPAGHVASFTRQLPLFTGNCDADAALAEVIIAGVPPDIRYVGGKPAGTWKPQGVGEAVMKSGDRTGLKHGVIVGLAATVAPYSAKGIHGIQGVTFTDVIVTSGISEDGDSGSLVLTPQRQAVGLLFGGQEDFDFTHHKKVTVASWCSPIESVLNRLQVTLV